jgi:hypothetical protein
MSIVPAFPLRELKEHLPRDLVEQQIAASTVTSSGSKRSSSDESHASTCVSEPHLGKPRSRLGDKASDL